MSYWDINVIYSLPEGITMFKPYIPSPGYWINKNAHSSVADLELPEGRIHVEKMHAKFFETRPLLC